MTDWYAKMHHWLWSLAERADWHRWPPRRFWRWLLWCADRRAGYHDGYIVPGGPDGPQQGPTP